MVLRGLLEQGMTMNNNNNNNENRPGADLTKPATVDLTGCESPVDLAQREGWDPVRYAVALAENVRNTGMSLDAHRERITALAGCGANADQASADALAQHYTVLEALHHRFTQEAFEALDKGGNQAAAIADRYLSAALKAQAAAMRVLSALKVLRDAKLPPTTPATPILGAAEAT